MSYRLNAAIGPFDVLRRVAPEEVVPLRHRMSLVLLPPAPEAALSDWSRSAAIGEVEVDLAAGDGWQTASLWRDGRRVWGPVRTTEFPVDRRHEWPVNALLARLGVVLAPRAGRPDYHDLFAEVGLMAERDHKSWRERAADARAYASYDAWLAADDAAREAARRAAAERAERARLALVPVPLDGAEVMRVLGIPAGPEVGEALRFLHELAADRGELSRTDALAALRSWDRPAG